MEDTRTEKCPYCNQPITHKELEQIEGKIKADFDAKMQKAESEARAKIQADEKRLAEERKVLEQDKTRAEQLRKQLEEERTAYRQHLEKETNERLTQEREQIRKTIEERQKELLEEGKKTGRLEGDTERRNLQKKIEDLSRQLERKTADELGALPEEELARKLSEVFREDNIARIPKGEQGADVRQDVMHKGVPCGVIIYESKNRKDWKNEYLQRAKEYKTMYKTSSVILVSITFPRGEQNFCIREGIVIVHPSIVVPVAEIIRLTILRLHLANLSQQEAATKMKEVYDFISGDQFKVQIDAIAQNVSDLKKIQQKEKEEHSRVWSKQETLFDSLQSSSFAIKSKIDNIIQRTD